MQNYVVFRLYGPMASWGQAAVGGDRPTAQQPSRSALLGLIAASLGIGRTDEQRQSELGQLLKFAIKQIAPGSLLRDYHTIQMPPQRKGANLSTRQREIREAKINTVLSNRDYRCDALWVVAATYSFSGVEGVDSICSALRMPVYAPYLGRKSCPMAIPMHPQLIEADNFQQALDNAEFPPLSRSVREDRFLLGSNQSVTYFWEGKLEEIPDAANRHYTTHPWDEPLSRERWQFGQRELHQFTLSEEV